MSTYLGGFLVDDAVHILSYVITESNDSDYGTKKSYRLLHSAVFPGESDRRTNCSGQTYRPVAWRNVRTTGREEVARICCPVEARVVFTVRGALSSLAPGIVTLT